MRMRDPLDGRGARGRTDGRWSDPILVVFLFSPPLSLALPTSFYICAPPPPSTRSAASRWTRSVLHPPRTLNRISPGPQHPCL